MLLLNPLEREPKYFFFRKPPHPTKLLGQPYPKDYEPLKFNLCGRRGGNVVEQVSKFLDVIAPHTRDKELCLNSEHPISQEGPGHLFYVKG